MSLIRSHAQMARMQEPDGDTYIDDTPNVETRAAVQRLWEEMSATTSTLEKLDCWAGDHDRTAYCGEARPATAAQIDAITERMKVVTDLVQVVYLKAQGVER